jgi:hypothetical protein
MSAAPGWVSFAALALSAGSLALAGLSYRAGGPRLRLQTQRLADDPGGHPFAGGIPVRLTVVNSGRAAVTVQGFHLTYTAIRKPIVAVEDVSGPALPFRLEAHASETWVVDALPAAREFDRQSGRDDPITGPAQFRFLAVAGNGRTVPGNGWFTAVRLIAEAQRDA